jgi:toxin ParE1/3/4
VKVRWTLHAVKDIKSISRFIARDYPGAARLFADKLKRRAESVTKLPGRGRIVDELGREDIREIIEGNYRIIYRVCKDTIDVLTIFEGHKLLAEYDPQD